MKNEQFCFSKAVGVIVVVGLLLIGFVIISQSLTKTQTSTNSRASEISGAPVAAVRKPICTRKDQGGLGGLCLSKKYNPTCSTYQFNNGGSTGVLYHEGQLPDQSKYPDYKPDLCEDPNFICCVPENNPCNSELIVQQNVDNVWRNTWKLTGDYIKGSDGSASYCLAKNLSGSGVDITSEAGKAEFVKKNKGKFVSTNFACDTTIPLFLQSVDKFGNYVGDSSLWGYLNGKKDEFGCYFVANYR